MMVENTSAPNTLLWQGSSLLAAKQRLAAADPQLLPAYAKLLRDAEKALTAGPFSVMDKPFTPPSGDKHDYYSIGPYWWPNPDTADGLPYIRRDGEVNPERERFDASQRSHMENAVITLALAYYFSEEERFAAHAAELLHAWFLAPAISMNPHLQYGQAVPGRNEGRGTGIIETRMFTRLVDAVQLLTASATYSLSELDNLRVWFRAYLDWLLNSKHGHDEAAAPNNHGTWYDVQVVTFALFVDDQATARRIVTERASRRISTQIAADGSQPRELERTRSLSYSLMNLTAMMDLADLGRHVGVDLWQSVPTKGRRWWPFGATAAAGIQQAVDYLLVNAVEQSWARQQITDLSAGDLFSIFQRAYLAYHDERYRQALTHLSSPVPLADRAQLLYAASG
ncbi:MAG: alginate lyase family protein [Caldilineaceae bacterium]